MRFDWISYQPTTSYRISAVIKIGSISFLNIACEFAEPVIGFINTTTDFGLPSAEKRKKHKYN